jgi:D-glycero-beta-D-manno-heptose-7-phosphate kinase
MPEELLGLVERLPGQRVLVVGDVMLDEYLAGDVRRISPEAPVPVVELGSRTLAAGGAGNAAANIAGLGGVSTLGAMVGADEHGEQLREVLKLAGVDFGGAVTDGLRPTTTKTRVVAGQQQVARVDHEDASPLSDPAREVLEAWYADACAHADAVLLCDYAKGLLTAEVCASLIAHARAADLPVVVDPKGTDYRKYRGATVITPNLSEVETATAHLRPRPVDADAAAGLLLAELPGTAVLLTRGPDGMTLLEAGAAPVSVPADTRHVFDVTGAGDTVVATVTVALAAGASTRTAMVLANHAAGLVVARPGTTTLQLEELRAALADRNSGS